MKFSIQLKSIVSEILCQTGIVRKKINKLSSNGYFPILMYHRIVPADEMIQAGMYVSPKTFENHLIFLNKYFNVVPLRSLTLGNTFENYLKNGKPPCVLTFDDGWKDFYDYAFPLLLKYHQPATVFLPTSIIDSGKKFWTDRFAYILSHQQKAKYEDIFENELIQIIHHLNTLTGTYEKKLEHGIEYLKQYKLNLIEIALDKLSEIWRVEMPKSSRDFLNWSEITEMRESDLISFGSHTVRHQILTTLKESEIEKELVDSLDKLLRKKALDSTFISFCYPNGNHTKKIVDIVRSCGYHLAVTTKKGWNHIDDDKHTLNRIAIHEDMTSTTALFLSRIAGFI